MLGVLGRLSRHLHLFVCVWLASYGGFGSHLQVFHPTAKMLVELSKSQDVEAGDGTTSVVVLCGSLLDACSRLLAKGMCRTPPHPTPPPLSESLLSVFADCVGVNLQCVVAICTHLCHVRLDSLG